MAEDKNIISVGAYFHGYIIREHSKRNNQFVLSLVQKTVPEVSSNSDLILSILQTANSFYINDLRGKQYCVCERE